MKTLDNFSSCLKTLKNADYERANDYVYRMGIVWQFILTYEQALQALQAVILIHGVDTLQINTPKEILQMAYKIGFINDELAWLTMMKKRKLFEKTYDVELTDELLLLIRNSFTPVLCELEKTLKDKIME